MPKLYQNISPNREWLYDSYMTKTLIILWLIGLHAFAALALWKTDLPYRIDRKLGLDLISPPNMGQFYDNMLGSHLQMDGSVAAGSVIFLGDSITQGLNVAAVTHPAINYGIGMDTTEGLLQRIPQYQSLSRASKIVLNIGINDLIRTNRSNSKILETYKLILEALPEDIPVLVHGIFPVDGRLGFAGFNTRINALNEGIKALADNQGFAYSALGEQFKDGSGNLQPTLHNGDGLHLSTTGYRLWIKALSSDLSTATYP